MEIIRAGNIKARKNHLCNGFYEIDATGEAEFIQATECKGTVNKGQQHYRQVLADNGKIYNWRSCFPCMKVINDTGILEE